MSEAYEVAVEDVQNIRRMHCQQYRHLTDAYAIGDGPAAGQAVIEIVQSHREACRHLFDVVEYMLTEQLPAGDAEIARLRERVAALEGALRQCSDVLVRVQNFRVAAPGEPFGARHPFSGAVGINPSERALREAPDYYETTDNILVACLRADDAARDALRAGQPAAGGA